MLFDLDDKPVTVRVRPQEYQAVRAQLSDADFSAVCDALNKYCDNNPAFTSSYIPGKNWQPPYISLYIAAGHDWNLARLFFGQIVWRVVLDRNDEWYFRPGETRANGDPLGMTYWRHEGKQ